MTVTVTHKPVDNYWYMDFISENFDVVSDGSNYRLLNTEENRLKIETRFGILKKLDTVAGYIILGDDCACREEKLKRILNV